MEGYPQDTERLLTQNISGFHCYRLEPGRSLTYVSDNLCRLLGVERDRLLAGTDGYAARIHPEDRGRYDGVLEELGSRETERTLTYRIARGSGEYLLVSDTLISSRQTDGSMGACSVLSDLTDINRRQRERETSRYIRAFSEIYDKIFAFDLVSRTVTCLCSHNSPIFRWTENVPMEMESATDRWVTATVCPEDRERVRHFLAEGWKTGAGDPADPPMIRYRAVSSSGEESDYAGLLLKLDEDSSLFCFRRTPDLPDHAYLMLCRREEEEAGRPEPRVRIRTFGYFDVFVDDRPIAFRHEKSKELLALLVDRRGGFLSSEEAIGYLWEDEPATRVTLARYRKVALRLKNTLEEYGVGDILESVNGRRRLVTHRVRCDLYDHLAGEADRETAFKGSYLSNYSWAETTLAELMND